MWLVALSLAACRHNAHTDPSALRADPFAAGTLEVPGAAGSATASLSPEVRAALEANFARVHFATDSALLDPEARAALAANAAILLDHRDVRVEVQGHADERGTVDYNLALGQRRGRVVIDELVARGVGPARLALVSYGEERPLVAGGGESVWAENRRAEFRLLTGPQGVHGTID
ncbi:MAG: OmpA family protein [Alphaproteobacteria bacterium]|nr:OmpA family protein [Alphaproteobacteria bacterium]